MVVVIEVKILKNGGLIAPSDLPAICGKVYNLVEERKLFDKVIIISGRLPLWAAAAITHTLHPVAAVALFEPRRNAGIVVATHTPAVRVGDVLPLEGDVEKIPLEFGEEDEEGD